MTGSSLTPYESLWGEIKAIARDATSDLLVFTARLSDEQKLIGLGLFIAILAILAIVYPARDRHKKSRPIQSILAFGLVIVFNFVAGWIIATRPDLPTFG